jgi:murein DD-endopeptidase MepM/ murein hydrolase activator NlpD
MLRAFMRRFPAVLVVATLFAVAGYGQASSETAEDELVLTPATPTNGSPFLITVALPEEAESVTGRWLGHPVVFFSRRDHETWFALAGVDVEVTPGSYPLTVEATLRDGRHRTVQHEISVGVAPYTEAPLSVPDKFVAPDAAALRKIAADKAVKERAFAHSDPKPEWRGDFQPPLHLAPQSDSFGNRRVFNGKLASVHRGLDYHAKAGTPVDAINSGRVVLARPLYFEGGCVVIDHGMGLMSVYMHLSKIEVAVGARVRRGQKIALSGASGRATGPHLHLGVRWQGSYLDPEKLFEISMPKR